MPANRFESGLFPVLYGYICRHYPAIWSTTTMPVSTDVTLPKDYTPAWPDRCIVCHNRPDSTIRIAHNAQNPILAFFLPILLLFGWSRVEIPICRACKPRFRFQRWGRELLFVGLALVATWFLMPYLSTWPRLTRKIVGVALVLLALSPYLLSEIIWPRIFDTTARADSVDYEFAYPEYAAEFHALNQSSVLRSDVETQT
jgi:hypothetical protein